MSCHRKAKNREINIEDPTNSQLENAVHDVGANSSTGTEDRYMQV